MQKTYRVTVRFIKRQTKLTIGIVAGLFIGGMGSVAVFAAIPDSGGVIHACYQTGALNSGQVRIIDSSTQSCSGDETAVSWNTATPGQFATNLIGADFTNAALSYRNFAEQDMHGSKLSGAVMNGANFSGANLSASTFGTIDGSNSQITTVLARKANFTGADLSGTSFSGNIDFTGTTFQDADLSNTDFTNANVTEGDFRQASLTNAALNGSYNGSNFAGFDFSPTHPNGAHFNENTNLTNAKFTDFATLDAPLSINFERADLTGSDFRNSNMESSTFRQAIVTNANFTGDSISDSDLRGTDFTDALLSGTTWSNTLCPDSTNSDDNGNTCVGHLAP